MTQDTIKVLDHKPHDFLAAMEASACYIEVDGKVLFIRESKKDEGRWGVPAGKIEPNETPEKAAKRELFEETGIVADPSQIVYIGTLFIRKPDLDYNYYLFKVHFDQKPQVRLSAEHSDYIWISSDEIDSLNLRLGAKEAFGYYRHPSELWIKNRQIDSLLDYRFAPVKPEQRELVHRWLDQPYINQWIHGVGLQNTFNGLDKFFQGLVDCTYWIAYDRDIPFAFLITAPEGEDVTALDVFICNINYLGRGLSAPMIRAFLTSHFSDKKTILIDPEATNHRAIHVYKKVGFKIVGDFIASWHPVRHYRMELSLK